MDGCVYMRDNEEYCFVSKPPSEGATVVCEAVTSPFLTGSSSPMSPATSSGQSGSTSGGPTGSTSPGPTGSTGSLSDLIDRANKAHEDKDAAEAAILEATATKEAAQDVSDKLTALDISKFVSNRLRRQAASTTVAYAAPANCNELKSTMTDLTNAMDSSSSEYNTARATAIVAILESLTSNDLSPACSSSDVSELNSAKDAAKTNADAVVTTQTNLIATKTEEYNEAVREINSLNAQIIAAGGTTIAPGTLAQTVPTVATNGPAGSTSTGPSGSTSGAPAGSSSGPPAGSTSGAPAGSTSGAPAGSTSLEPAGSTSGAPTGSTSGSPAGSTSG